MFTIPSEIVLNILSRVPAICLISRFRCVCKEWCLLINDDPYFNKIHTDRNIHDESKSESDSIQLLDTNHRRNYNFCSLSLNSPNHHTYKTNLMGNLDLGWLASCNGLILTHHYKDNWSIGNPLTKEIHYLPSVPVPVPGYNDDNPETTIRHYELTSGFGYSRVEDDYKVVKHSLVWYNNEVNHQTTSIYSLKTNSWKRIDNSSFSIKIFETGILCNGALHWIGCRREEEENRLIVVAIDLESEDIRFYSLPKVSLIFNHFDPLYLTCLGGCLSLHTYNNYNGQGSGEIWLMNNYGDENSWSKLYPYPNQESFINCYFRPIFYSKSKQLLLILGSKFILVDLKNNKSKFFPKGRHEYYNFPRVFVPSLVRIKGGTKSCKRKRCHDDCSYFN